MCQQILREDEIHNLSANESFKVFLDHFHYLLIGGDQLTIERAIGAKKERSNENRGVYRQIGRFATSN